MMNQLGTQLINVVRHWLLIHLFLVLLEWQSWFS